jgi:hypothetical protein
VLKRSSMKKEKKKEERKAPIVSSNKTGSQYIER